MHTCITTLFTYTAILPPNNVRATALTPHAVKVMWVQSLSDATGYLISYTTIASYTSGGNVTVNGHDTTSYTLTNLEENTLYTITIQATTDDNRMSVYSNEVSVTTYTDGKCYIISCKRFSCYNSTVPSSPPQNVTVVSVNPASLGVSWQQPPVIYLNGPITGYVIQYTRVGSSDMMSENISSGNAHRLSRLFPYVNYSVTVAVVNVNGTGPFSSPIVERSGEDGEY